MGIVLYTTNCPQCHVLEAALKNKNLEYTVVTDMEQIMRVANASGISTVPFMKLDDVIMAYGPALRWVNEHEGGDPNAK